MKLKSKIVIIGGEGTATNIAEAILDAQSNYGFQTEFIGFANDYFGIKKEISGYPIVCKIQEIAYFLKKNDGVKVIYALYKPLYMKRRTILLNNLLLSVSDFFNFIHPKSYVAQTVKIGIGNVLMPNAVIQSHVTINNFNIINSHCIIEHDTIIGSYNFFASGCAIGSSVKISDSNFFGLNSCVREGLIIPEATFFGMGSIVVKSPNENNEIWYGNPAKRIRLNDN